MSYTRLSASPFLNGSAELSNSVAQVHTHIHTHIYTHTHIHTYTHIYTHAHIYIYTYRLMLSAKRIIILTLIDLGSGLSGRGKWDAFHQACDSFVAITRMFTTIWRG